MYFFTIHGVPTPSGPDYEKAGGAFINCWVERSTLQQAEAVARQWIEGRGWQIDEVTESLIVDRSYYSNGHDKLRYFEQAEIDKEVFVFHIHPPEGVRSPSPPTDT